LNWDPTGWKKSRKILLGIATVWPPIYMLLFMLTIFSVVSFFTLQSQRLNQSSEDIDLIQLEQKIRNGEVSQLTIRPTEIVACDRSCECEYHTAVSNRSTRAEIIRQARAVDQNGVPRVPKIDENTSQTAAPALLPIGLVALFGVHIVSVFLMLGLLPVYIVLAVKRDQFDQTARIVWIILICMMGTVAMPAYWYLYVWREPPVKLAGESTTGPPADDTSGTS
jgi:hypothetical protein